MQSKHTQGNMSVIYMSSKRKISRPEKKPQTGDPKIMEKVVAVCSGVSSTNESSNPQPIKRTYGRKRYHDLHPVSKVPPEDASSCTPPVHANAVNGSKVQKVECDPVCRTRDKDGPAFEIMRKRVPVIVPVAQFAPTRSPSANGAKSKTSKSDLSCVKKETPSYPPGSQEEAWQLQILAKGRVTCPKCKRVGRKTVEGLKKHMVACKLPVFKCTHCGKQLKTLTGMKYHLMADHNKLPNPDDGHRLDDHAVKEKLRKVLKRLGKLKCSKEGCTGSFTSIMGYVYHMKKCGKAESELEKLLMNCKHCGKPYRSRAGLEYHLKSEHGPAPQPTEANGQTDTTECESSGRAKRTSAQVAIFHLREIANQELFKEWPKRKVQRDLVPDDGKLRYSRPGLPAFSQEVLRKWKNEVKLNRKMQCPNKGCGCYYTSVSGLKAHLGLCTLGNFHAGKYTCLICKKEFNSESGVKYHINSVHSQDWFVVTTKAKSFTSTKKLKPKKLPPTNPAVIYHQGPCTRQKAHRTSSDATTGECAFPGTSERKPKGKRKSRKCSSRAQEKGGSDSQSSSSESESSSSHSEQEGPENKTWKLNKPSKPPPVKAKNDH